MTGSNPAWTAAYWAGERGGLPLAGPHEAMWQWSPASRRLRSQGGGYSSFMGVRLQAVGIPEQAAQVRQAVLPPWP